MKTDYTCWGQSELIERCQKQDDKIQKIIDLLIDKNVGKLIKAKQLENKDEEFGALVFAGYAFTEAYKIIDNN